MYAAVLITPQETTLKYIFYKANSTNATWLDKLVAKLDGGRFSHVEVVIGETDTHWKTVGCRISRGGVTPATIAKTSDWITAADDIELPNFIGELYTPYSILKAPRTRWKWFPSLGKGLVCSTFVAKMQGRADYEYMGVQDLWVRTKVKGC